MPGALDGIRIVELAGIGPAPFACMMLADHGAQVVRVERPGGLPSTRDPARNILLRSRERIMTLDLKESSSHADFLALVSDADGIVEGFRPGVMERLGLGPAQLLAWNSRLVFGRMTGWGQDGPAASEPGHDINYIALSGNLHTYGRAGSKPTPPINAVGDFGGGGMLLAFGMLAGLLSARTTGKGQVVDCAMVDGAALLASAVWSLRAQGLWSEERGTNLLDTGAPFYDTYQTQDGRFIAVGAIEPQFYAVLLQRLGLENNPLCLQQMDRSLWPAQRDTFATVFASRTREEWVVAFDGAEACLSPVLSMAEAPDHLHNRARGTFSTAGGVTQPAPAPRFSVTPALEPRMVFGEDTPLPNHSPA